MWNYYQFAREPGPNALAPGEVMTGGFMKGFFFPMVQLMDGKAQVIWPSNSPKRSSRRRPG